MELISKPRGPQPEDFDTLAQGIGYPCALEMFLDLYEGKHLTTVQIGELLGYSVSNIRRRMIRLGIELHKPGRRREQ